MARTDFTAYHRPVIRAGVAHPTDPMPLSDWTTNWAEARHTLLVQGLAFYVHGILVILPHATIEMEISYG